MFLKAQYILRGNSVGSHSWRAWNINDYNMEYLYRTRKLDVVRKIQNEIVPIISRISMLHFVVRVEYLLEATFITLFRGVEKVQFWFWRIQAIGHSVGIINQDFIVCIRHYDCFAWQKCCHRASLSDYQNGANDDMAFVGMVPLTFGWIIKSNHRR